MLKLSSIILLLLLIVGVILWQWRFAMPPLPTVNGPAYPPQEPQYLNTCIVGDIKFDSDTAEVYYCSGTSWNGSKKIAISTQYFYVTK